MAALPALSLPKGVPCVKVFFGFVGNTLHQNIDFLCVTLRFSLGMAELRPSAVTLRAMADRLR
ncbi:MAG: hypothetical protein RRA15_02725 [bacterium]|nr:hypothetical protein [bacterium]